MGKESTELVRSALLDLDFAAIHDYMEAVDWFWYIDGEMRLPTHAELYQAAEKLLYSVLEDGGYARCGGFMAYVCERSLGICFALSSSEVSSNEQL